MIDPLAPRWKGCVAVVVASGPSLDAGQIEIVRREHEAGAVTTIATNRSFEMAPWSDVIWGCDMGFWRHYHDTIRNHCRRSELWTMSTAAAERYRLNLMRGFDRPGIGTTGVHSGGNSGYQAVNLAAIWGCRAVILIGMDMRLDEEGRKHFFGEHEGRLIRAVLFDEWIRNFQTMVDPLKSAGVRVINATPNSALRCFEMMPLADALEATR